MSATSRISSIFARRSSFLGASEAPAVEANGGLYEPNVLLVVAGGTICMQDSSAGLVTSKLFLDECLSPKPTFNDGTPCPTSEVTDEHGITRDVPVLRLPRDRSGAHVRCTVLEFDPLLDSSTAHAPTWNQLARTVRANERKYDAFVICHGTDTLAYSAAALSFLLMPALDKTVVLTGAQRSMFFADSDGSDNLLGSIVLASHVRIPEVCVYFGHRLLKGTRITKVSASSYAGFESPNAGPLATVSETGIVVHWDNLHEDSLAPIEEERKDSLVEMISRSVVVLKIFPGITPEFVDAILSVGHLRGAVLETFGAGNIPLALVSALSQAVKRGIVIVNITQCLHGSVSSAYEPARKLADIGVVPGVDMTTEAAYTKLIFLLASSGVKPIDVAKLMAENICGELTPPTPQSLNHGPLSIAQLPIRYEKTVPDQLGDFQRFGRR